MIFIKDSEILLKPSLTLYNNTVRSGKHKAHLQAKLEIFPSPRIFWEYESLGRLAYEPSHTDWILNEPLIGVGFRIEKPFITNLEWGSISNISKVCIKGVSTRTRFGASTKFTGDTFRFLLPNASFQERNLISQGELNQSTEGRFQDEKWEAGSGSAGRLLIAPIDKDWHIYLETRKDALEWMKPQRRNFGTYITTFGRLFQPKSNTKKEAKTLKRISMDQAVQRLELFSKLLSFANGGYLGPLYIEGVQKGNELKASGVALAYRTTPLELLGPSWLTIESDLVDFIKCMPAFEKMGGLPHWKEEFGLILAWYFQAIQPQSVQTGKPWPIVANAVGAALERLAVLILVRDLGKRGIDTFEKRIREMLGIMNIHPITDGSQSPLIRDFIDLRNDATHARRKSKLSHNQIEQVLAAAIQWVEEIILWRLGYAGKYRDRTKTHDASTKLRYDLANRHPDW
jgi:hypothetical protein